MTQDNKETSKRQIQRQAYEQWLQVCNSEEQKMSDNQFKAGILAGAVGVLAIGAALSGSLSKAGSSRVFEHSATDKSVVSDARVYRNNKRFSGPRSDFTVTLDDFSRMDVRGVMELEVTAGEDQKVHVEVADAARDLIEFYVKNDTLYVEMEDGDYDDLDLEVTISVPKMDAFILRGAVDAKFKNLDSEEFDLQLRGAGNVVMEGSCETVNILLKGAGNIEADRFKCKNAFIESRGAGNIEAYASDRTNVELKGIGSVQVKGSPKEVEKDIGGIGSIEIR